MAKPFTTPNPKFYVISNRTGTPLVLVKYDGPVLSEWILDWYAKEYAMDRKNMFVSAYEIAVIEPEYPLEVFAQKETATERFNRLADERLDKLAE